MDDTALFRFAPRLCGQADHAGARLVGVERRRATRVTEAEERARHRAATCAAGWRRPWRCATTTVTAASSTRGTMCPSYRVTRDEQHLTRGRANTLRLALSGQLGAGGAASRRREGNARPVRVLQGLQARLPHRRRHGEDEDRGPRRPRQGRQGCACATAWSPSCRATRALASRAAVAVQPARPRAGAARRWASACSACPPERSLPRWQAAFLPAATTRPKAAGGKEVVLFVDTFNNHMEPENARAAQRVLEGAGYTVHLSAVPGRAAAVLRPHLPGGGSGR